MTERLTDEQLQGYHTLPYARDMAEELLALRARVAKLEAALRYGAGSAINELTARGLPKEWSPESGIGVMLEALGCAATMYDDACRAALKEAPQ